MEVRSSEKLDSMFIDANKQKQTNKNRGCRDKERRDRFGTK